MLNGKVALVTGAGAGIGRAIAQAYAAAGASVMATDLDPATAEETAQSIRDGGGTATSMALDTTDPEQHHEVVAAVEQQFGRLDVAANNAGVTAPPVPTAELSVEQWEKVRTVDLDGVFYGVRAQIPAMLRAGGGVIVTVSSIFGKRGVPGMAPYAAAKHGVLGLIETVAWEYGDQGIRALSVGPAFIKTGLENNLTEDMRNSLPGLHAVGRMGEPHEVGQAVAWLSSDQASFMTGSYIPIDGGYLAR